MASDPGTIGEVLAGATSGNLGLSEEIARLAEQLGQLQTARQAAIEQAAIESGRTGSQGTAGGSSAGGASSRQSMGSTLLDAFGAGLGLSPLISGIASLFGGGGNSVPAPLLKFAPAPSIQVSGGVSESGGSAFAVDNPQGGLPRAAPAGGQAGGPSQITVQVQAMDSQSFLDHSGDIAMAVRQAMLQSSVLNDVVREA
jgi:hypothetical protein